MIYQKQHLKRVKEGTRNAMDAAGNTGQYIKFVNKHIDKQKKEIDKIKKIKERFDQEVELLQSHNPNLLKLDVDSLENFDIQRQFQNIYSNYYRKKDLQKRS